MIRLRGCYYIIHEICITTHVIWCTSVYYPYNVLFLWNIKHHRIDQTCNFDMIFCCTMCSGSFRHHKHQQLVPLWFAERHQNSNQRFNIIKRTCFCNCVTRRRWCNMHRLSPKTRILIVGNKFASSPTFSSFLLWSLSSWNLWASHVELHLQGKVGSKAPYSSQRFLSLW